MKEQDRKCIRKAKTGKVRRTEGSERLGVKKGPNIKKKTEKVGKNEH